MAFLRCVDLLDNSQHDVALKKRITSVGRADGCDVVLKDNAIAKTHAQIVRTGDDYKVSVTDRKHDLNLNGSPTRSSPVSPGDKIQVGRFEIELCDGQPADATNAPGAIPVEAMERLVTFSGSLMSETSPERLFKKLLEAVVQLTDAEKGFVIVLKDGERHLATSHNVGKETLDLSRVSDSIIDQVLEHRRPIIVSDAMADRKFGRSRSVVDLKLSSVMCVPLLY
ncbi:MAG: FHA domain-containing protein, partial [Myxococcota bacterium]|nr:FHA domain-containing protein [Myxococcota bacterium]